MKKIVEYKLKFYEFDRDLFEPEEIFYERVWFIFKRLETDSIENLIKKSRIYINMKYHECTYLPEFNFS
jgi:hypothetical protein